MKGVKELKVVDEIPITDCHDMHNCLECQYKTKDLLQLSIHMEIHNKIRPENLIPERLKKLLTIKGINISDNILVRTVGRGKCGVNRISIYTTGSEVLAGEIRENVNEHIVRNWDIYIKTVLNILIQRE